MTNLYETLDALRLLRTARVAVIYESATGWRILNRASEKLEREVAAHLRGED